MALDLTTAAEALSEASTLFTGLITGAPALPTFPTPPVLTFPTLPTLPADLTAEVTTVDVDDLTSGAVAGPGVFDKLMSAVSAHIKSQYDSGILGKSEVANVYIAAIQTVLPQAIQLMLSEQQSYWQAKLVQIQGQNAFLERTRLEADLVTAQLNAYRAQAEAYTAQVNGLTAQGQYANTKLALVATLQSVNSAETQQAVNEANYNDTYLKTSNVLPGGGAPGGHASRDFALKDEQLVVLGKQELLLTAQANVQRAQTYDTNTDTTPVAGVIGVQKDLYNQQIESYINDGKNKGVKMVADLWTSAKALDDSVQSPGPLAGNLMTAMNKYMNDLDLPNHMVSVDSPATGLPSQDTDPYTPGDQ